MICCQKVHTVRRRVRDQYVRIFCGFDVSALVEVIQSRGKQSHLCKDRFLGSSCSYGKTPVRASVCITWLVRQRHVSSPRISSSRTPAIENYLIFFVPSKHVISKSARKQNVLRVTNGSEKDTIIGDVPCRNMPPSSIRPPNRGAEYPSETLRIFESLDFYW